ncbi:MAG: succinylglutamate-semialdehyde dehydrogenase [Anaerolineae bacterium]|nr:succinylglutamate-semialdehyde dehydrogenase [Phycisphaerae bacterium]
MHFINGEWIEGTGPALQSHEPVSGGIVWSGRAAKNDEVNRAILAARAASKDWANLPLLKRADYLNAFAQQLRDHKAELVEMICRETGKPRWESSTEVDAMINKIALSIEAQAKRRAQSQTESAGVIMATRYKPHGVVAVLGPFNFPGHLPNGHIVPALLSGNTIVFKPSELTPGVAQKTTELCVAAGLPAGVLNLVQGAKETGTHLVSHPGIDGVFFTGSFTVGRAINRALADHPGKIAALEMGGNNPLIVHNVSDLTAAAYWTIQSAFVTAGQRCSCARRLIVPEDASGNKFIDRLVEMTRRVIVGPYTQSPEPFMGPVITEAAAQKLLQAQTDLQSRAAGSLIEMEARSANGRHTLLSPGIIDVSGDKDREDVEFFGPLLQLIRVKNFDQAIAEANNTRFGLAAGLFSDDHALFNRFYREARAGVINFNRPLTGASSALPFGGVGDSGNHRPSAYFASDYCSYPVAMMETEKLAMPKTLSPGIQNDGTADERR